MRVFHLHEPSEGNVQNGHCIGKLETKAHEVRGAHALPDVRTFVRSDVRMFGCLDNSRFQTPLRTSSASAIAFAVAARMPYMVRNFRNKKHSGHACFHEHRNSFQKSQRSPYM
eukprot:5456998-Pyramimonas_sp.AAC.1